MRFVYNWMDQKLLNIVKHLSREARERVWVASPYVGNDSYQVFDENLRSMDDVRFIIDFSRNNVAMGATNPWGVEQLAEIGNVRNSHLPDDLHAKVFIFDDQAIVGSPNLSWKALRSNIEAAVVVKDRNLVERIVAFFKKLWNAAEPVEPSQIEQMKEYWRECRPLRESYSLRQIDRIPTYTKRKERWSRPVVPSGDDRHILINHNWNPHGYRKPCTDSERLSGMQRICCHESRRCYDEAWDYCASSYLFKNYEYATSKKAIKKKRLVFFIARNPNINNQYYVCGFLYMVSDKPGIKTKWGKETVYYFEGSKKKSVRLPGRGNSLVKFDKALVSKLHSLGVYWSRKPEGYDDTAYIGSSTRKNPRYISKEDAVTLLRECYRKTKDKRVLRILKDDFAVKTL